MKRLPFMITTCCFMALGLVHCHKHKTHTMQEDVLAKANMQGKSGQNVSGHVLLRQTDEGVSMSLDLQGLPANSTHAFHVHQTGDCSAPDAKSAGGHFNPDNHDHGAPSQDDVHAGDMGNIQSDAQGRVQTTLVNDRINLYKADNHSVLNRALIVHATEDHFDVQPSGNAGPRVSCGVIQVVQ